MIGSRTRSGVEQPPIYRYFILLLYLYILCIFLCGPSSPTPAPCLRVRTRPHPLHRPIDRFTNRTYVATSLRLYVSTPLRRYVATSLRRYVAIRLHVAVRLHVATCISTSLRRYFAASGYVSTYPRAPAPHRPLDRFTNPSYAATSLLLHVAASPRRCVATPL